MTQKATVIAVVNQKGGTGKTTTCENLGIGLAMEGKKVLMVDVDPQASLTISMGWPRPDELDTTLSSLMGKALADKPAPVCIDATCGNGHDTVFLAGLGGRILALDIQPAAVQATRARLTAAGYADPARYQVVQADHAGLARLADREGFAPADGVMFNFGWLPGADHGVQSRAHSSRTALAAALELLAPGGALTAVLYSPGHGPQEEEKQAVLAQLTGLDRARFSVTVHPGHPGAPLPVLVRRLPV